MKNMNGWKVLGINDSNEWTNLVESCQQPDLHFLPEYLKLYEKKVGGNALLFVSNDQKNENLVLYPFFLRNIKKIKIFSELKEEYYDIISPWYYGGPLVKTEHNKVKSLKLFLSNFQEYVKTKKIISEFTRIHPILDSNQEFSSMVDATPHDYISFIDLKQDCETIWKNFKKSNKNAINSAKKHGIEIEISRSDKSIEIFSKFYNDNMKHLDTDDWYFFSLDFFKKLTNNFKKNFVVAKATYQNETIATSLFLYKYGISYYWLSGYDYAKRNLNPNNLLLFEVIKWLKEHENHCFILGGGSETLNKFKQSFTNTATKKFHLNKIHHPLIYTKLLTMYGKNNPTHNENFFPDYRPK